MRTLFTLPMLLLLGIQGFAEDPVVVLATTRAGRIDAFDQLLARLGSIAVNSMVESVTASPDGRKLYIAQEQRGECCGLYSLDMETHKMCAFGPFGTAAMFAVPSGDGHLIFTQTSNGLAAYDAKSFAYHMQNVKTAGTYNLQPSPDGQWLLGISNSGEPHLDVFDLKKEELEHHLKIPVGPAVGAWAGDKFYMFSYTGAGTGRLWSVKPGDSELPEAKEIQLPDLHGACNEPVLLMLAGAEDRLFLAEAFGYKVDRRSKCPGMATGGIYSIHPSTGSVSRIATSVRVHRMVVTPDGNDVYVLNSNDPAHHSDVRLVHVDGRSGGTVSSATLESGDWSLALTHMPYAMLPRGYVRAAISCGR